MKPFVLKRNGFIFLQGVQFDNGTTITVNKPGSNTPPSVTITEPADGTTFATGDGSRAATVDTAFAAISAILVESREELVNSTSNVSTLRDLIGTQTARLRDALATTARRTFDEYLLGLLDFAKKAESISASSRDGLTFWMPEYILEYEGDEYTFPSLGICLRADYLTSVDSAVCVRRKDGVNESAVGDYYHPHINNDGRICRGDVQGAMAMAITHQEPGMLLLLVDRLLATYNPASPYRSLDEWSGEECDYCGASGFSEDDMTYDPATSRRVCPGCLAGRCAHSGAVLYNDEDHVRLGGSVYSPSLQVGLSVDDVPILKGVNDTSFAELDGKWYSVDTLVWIATEDSLARGHQAPNLVYVAESGAWVDRKHTKLTDKGLGVTWTEDLDAWKEEHSTVPLALRTATEETLKRPQSGQSPEEWLALRAAHRVHVHGSDDPEDLKHFEALVGSPSVAAAPLSPHDSIVKYGVHLSEWATSWDNTPAFFYKGYVGYPSADHRTLKVHLMEAHPPTNVPHLSSMEVHLLQGGPAAHLIPLFCAWRDTEDPSAELIAAAAAGTQHVTTLGATS